MSQSAETEPWICPLCDRKFKIAVGSKWTACPDCQKRPVLKRNAAVQRRATVTEQWFIQLASEPESRGPLTLEEVRDLYRRGTLSQVDFAQNGADGMLRLVSTFPELVAYCSVPDIPVFTTETACQPGMEITQHLSVVFARRIYGINLFGDLTIAVADLLGGRSKRAEQAIVNIEAELLADVRRQANAVGANGIVGLRVEMGNLSGGNSQMLYGFAHGTPVVFSQSDFASDSTAES
ncbi:MAG: heavy metal-binding domain-containing protein [Planctomycetota bacterium]